MHVRLIAVGDRQPAWVDTAVAEYAARLPRQWQFGVDALAVGKARKGAAGRGATEREGATIMSRIGDDDFVVVLDERGRQHSSREFASLLERWQAAGRDLKFVIGGPDGIAPDVSARANASWSLSKLTFPHGLARVVFVEQLYRAWSLSAGHPYHRD